ncbi:hypothetical protein [Gemmatimonas sp.]|uniref:hypothetical protein n=1 Tax=Gemmatimonas sp. TaxID=1962908 RepID=UPI00356533D0
MASALPGDICVGQHSVCLLRAAQLNADCTPVSGADAGIITPGIITATATPEFIDGANFEPVNGCGDIAWTYETRNKIRRYTVAGELTYFDHEAMALLFGGQLVVGRAGTPYPAKNIGWASPWYTDDDPGNVYLEFIVKTAAEGVGDCTTPGDPFPPYVGHIFPKATLVPGDRTFEFDAATLTFDGFSVSNPNIGIGPWGDWPGVGNIPNTGYIQVSYSQAEYDDMLALAACGHQPVST